MARIPDLSQVGFGGAPQEPYTRPIYGDSGTQIAEGMLEAGNTLQRQGEQDYASQVNLARAKASNALLDRELAVKGIQQQIGEDVNSGKLPFGQAAQSYQDQVGKLGVPAIDGLDPVGQENFENGLKRLEVGGALGVQEIARSGQKQAFVDQFSAAQDKLGKLAGMPGADIEGLNKQLASYRPMALAAGIPSGTVDAQIQNFQDRSWFNQAEQRAIGARESLPDLKTLATDLSDPKGFYAGKLDANNRTALLRLVTNDQIVLQNKQQLEQQKALTKATGWMNQANELIASGVSPSPAMWQQGAALTKGTPLEVEYGQALKDDQTVQQVLRLPPDQQMAFVQKKVQALETGGGTPRDRIDLMRLQTAVSQNVQLLQKAPLQWSAQRDGNPVQPLDFSGLNSPQGQQQIGQELADRMTTLGAMQKQYGAGVQTLPLLPQEAATLSNQLDTAPAAQRVQLLASLHDAAGSDAAYSAVLRQIAPHSPVTAIVGGIVGHAAPRDTPLWFDQQFAPALGNADLILHGEQLLNPQVSTKADAAAAETGKGSGRGFPMPADTGMNGMRTAFSTAAGDMFQGRPQLAEAYYSVFKDAYASLAAQKGNVTGVADPALERQALTVALGNQASFNGTKYSVPYGMDPGQFTGLVQNAVAGAAQKSGAPADWAQRIRGYQLRELGGLGSGRYMLVNGNTPLVRPDGHGPFTIDLHNQYLASNGGTLPAPQPSSFSLPANPLMYAK